MRGIWVLVTGMGEQNASDSIRAAFASRQPRLVMTCGFAGGLTPDLKQGQIIISTKDARLNELLTEEGAKSVRFHCAARVAATAEEKRLLRQETGAEAVEMESKAICNICEENGVPSATVRVVLDEAEQDLPLDFNRVMTGKLEIDYFLLAIALFRRPRLIPPLLRFQMQARSAAGRLAEFLARVIARS